MLIGGKNFDTTHEAYVMGILNLTPDSFSDGGRYQAVDQALFRIEEMIQEGASIIDIGGESTRPGYQMISPEEEIERTSPLIRAASERFDIPLSIDTYKAPVARAALEAGAAMVNDIWGFRYDPLMAETVSSFGASCCLMHNRASAVYDDLIGEIQQDLALSVKTAVQAGIPENQIMIDPGIGFGKTYEMNLQVLREMAVFCRGPYPVLLACSRKSVIGNTLHLPVEERLEGTLALTAAGVLAGCAFVRVHDVQANVRAIKMALAIRRNNDE